MRVAIIGAGISGLSTAFFLKEKGFDVHVFESSARAGGTLGTDRGRGFTVEWAANGMLANEPATLELIDRLKLETRVMHASHASRKRFIYIDQKLHPVPMSPLQLLRSDLISSSAKRMILAEPFKKKKFIRESANISEDETIVEFGARHFGSEVAERIVGPASIGIFAGDAHELVLDLAFPKIRGLEREFGSVILGQMQSRTQRSGLFSFQNGMQELIDALVERLGDRVHLNTSIASITKSPAGNWKLGDVQADFEHLILTSAPLTWSQFFPQKILSPALSGKWGRSPLAPALSVSFAFDQEIKFEGFGILVAQKSYSGKVLGVLHPPDIFPHRAPEGQDLFTLIMGGSFSPSAVNSPTQTAQEGLNELSILLGTKLPPPIQTWVWPHRPGIPQYTAVQRVIQNEMREWVAGQPGLWLNTTALGGVAVNDCIRKAKVLSEVMKRSGLV